MKVLTSSVNLLSFPAALNIFNNSLSFSLLNFTLCFFNFFSKFFNNLPSDFSQLNVVINFVLQFLDRNKRTLLIEKIFKGLNPGGVLLISEKVHFQSDRESKSIFLLHHLFKEMNGYTKMEIAAKRDSLEGVMVTETEEQHFQRMKRVGFRRGEKLMSNLNFATYLFIK